MKTNTLRVVHVMVGLLTAATALGQGNARKNRGEGWNPGSAYSKLYNPQAVETIRGQVAKVETVKPLNGMGPGLHLLLRTDSGMIPVHLGPSWFIEQQDLQIEINDEVEITGSRVSLQGEPTLIAAEIKKGEEELRLRDENGHPAWAASRPVARARQSRGPMMGVGRGMMRPGMMEERRQMMDEHQQMLARWKSMDAELQQRVEKMNTAQGEEKTQAMAEVINNLVEHRLQMLNRMATLHQRMMSNLNQPGVPPPGAATPRAPESIHEHQERIEPTGRPQGALRMPSPLAREHEELHAELAKAVQSGGRTAQAAKEVEERLSAHFQEENDIAMPPLGLLSELVANGATEQMRPAIAMGREVQNRLSHFLQEHERIQQALQQLEEAARTENKPEQAKFAQRLRLHAQTEEQVLYPTTILIGRYVEDKLSR